MSKFKALKEIIEGVAPAVAKEGEEAAASALAKEAEEAAAREAFKSEFNLPVAHGTNLERTGDEIIEEFIPSNSPQMTYGEGIYTGIIHPNKSPTSNRYTLGSKGGFNVPLRVRGNKIFNLYDRTLHDRFPHLKGIIPTVDESYQKLSNLHVGHPQLANALERIYARDGVKGIEEYIRQYPEHFEGILAEPDTGIVKLFEPKNVRLPWAKFDPKKRNSGNIADSIVAATTGAGAYSALSPESAEASEIKEKPKSQLKDLLKDYSPSFGSKTGDYSSYDESEALPTEGMQGQGLATILRNIIADKKPPSEFEEGGGGIEESAISPIDLVTPGMVTTPAKALGRGALTAGKAGLEAVESGAQALAKRYPELAKRLADNRGSIDLSKKLKSIYDDESVLKTVTPDIEELEREWIGGISDFGNPEAANAMYRVPEYEEYKKALTEYLRKKYGDKITLYRSMPQEQLDKWMSESRYAKYGKNYGFTTDKDVAEKWENFAGNKGKKHRVIETEVSPEDVLMRGSSSEKELVIPAHKIKSEKIKIIRQLIAAGFTVDQIQKMMEEKLPDNLNL